MADFEYEPFDSEDTDMFEPNDDFVQIDNPDVYKLPLDEEAEPFDSAA